MLCLYTFAKFLRTIFGEEKTYVFLIGQETPRTNWIKSGSA